MYTQEITVQNEVGLHARPATYFIQKANEFKSGIWVEKEERRVNAKSLLGVCIVMLLFQHAWIYAALVFGYAVLVFLAVMFAELISLGLEALTGKLSQFIFS